MKGLALLILVVLICTPAWLPGQSITPSMTIHELFVQDQHDQQIDNEKLPLAEQKKLRARYDQREVHVKELMQSGSTRNPQDFFEAAVILTHSHVPENQLLAHLAFTAAAFGGITEAKHLAATSLDRYLLFSKQTPFFGTIFHIPYRGFNHPVSPVMNDSIRATFCVPSRKELDEQFAKQKSGVPMPDVGHDEFWDVRLQGCGGKEAAP